MPRKEVEKRVWKEKLPQFKTEQQALEFSRQSVGCTGCSRVIINGRPAHIFGVSIHYDEVNMTPVRMASENFSEEKEKAWEETMTRLSGKRRKLPAKGTFAYYQYFGED